VTIELTGNWEGGTAFDVHTTSSKYLGVDEFGHDHYENKRSEMGELVYRLKYKGDQKAIGRIVELLDAVKGIELMDTIIPIPSTDKSRRIQPVIAIATALGERRDVAVSTDLLDKTPGGQQLKNVRDREERVALLEKHMKLSETDKISKKKILLLDDLYRSGATLTVATDLLYKQGCAKTVSVLTMTKTRSNR